MNSLFARKRNLTPEMLTLPAFCIPAEESAKLLSKREAQLEWMRAEGVEYVLNSPVKRHTPVPKLDTAPASRRTPAPEPMHTPEKRVA